MSGRDGENVSVSKSSSTPSLSKSSSSVSSSYAIPQKNNKLMNASITNYDEEAGFTPPMLSTSPDVSMARSPSKSNKSTLSNSDSNNSLSTSGDLKCTTRWIECILVATFDIELGQKIQQAYPRDYPLSQQQLSDIAYLSFPDGNNQTSTSGGSSEKPVTCTWAFRTSEDIFGYVHFLQQQDSTIKRGCSMTSIIILTKYPFIKLYRYLVQKIATLYFAEMEKQKTLQQQNAAESVSDTTMNGTFIFESAFRQINNWILPKVDAHFELPFFEQKIKYRSPLFIPSSQSIQNRLNQLRPRDGGGVSSVTPLKERLLGRKYPYQQEVNIYRNFINHDLENLAKFWELVLIGEPILVLSPTPTQCCVSVFSLVSMIAPVPYGGDIRPYFTVHNQDFKYFSQMGGHQGFTSAIVGVTNPFFIKAYENWPHIITVGKQYNTSTMKKSASTNNTSNTLTTNKIVSFFTNIDNESNERRKQLMWDYKETFISKKKSFIVTDIDLSSIKLLTDNIHESDRNSADTINNDQIRKFFEELTEVFLHPIHQCFDTLVCSMKTFIVRSEHAKVFKTEKFINYVKKNGYNEKVFKANKSAMLEFYKKFIYSSNFKTFLEHRLREAYVNDVQHTDINEFLKNEKFSDIDLIDLFLQIKQDLAEEIKTYDDDVIVVRLQLFLSQILDRLPDTLKTHLERQLNNMYEDLRDC